jgi:hypothetical protein
VHFPKISSDQYQEAKALVASEEYYVIIIINSHVNRMARRVAGNIGECATAGSETVQRGCDGIRSIGIFFCGLITHTFQMNARMTYSKTETFHYTKFV